MSILKNKRTPVLTFPFNTRDKRPFIQIKNNSEAHFYTSRANMNRL